MDVPRSPRHTLTEDLRARIVALFESGRSRADIQRETDVSQPTIRRVLAGAGYPPDTKNRTEVDDDLRRAVKDRYEQVRNARKVAAEFGLARRTVLGIIADLSGELRPRGGGSVSAEAFIKAWQEGDNLYDVARALGLTLAGVHSRAMQYRTKGVPLKRYARSARYDWETLKAFAELFVDKDGAEEG